MRIDAHQHFWRLADRGSAWPPPALAAIHHDFMPADLLPHLQAGGIDGTVLVQSLPSRADTDFMLALAAQTPFVLGVVGWADLKAPDAATQIARLAWHPLLRGLRPMLQDLPDDWLDDPALDPAVAAMLSHGLCFDALVWPAQLPALWRFAQRHPDLPIVIDHAAKPPIAAGLLQPWADDLARLATLPQLHCKLSGLLTEAGPNADGAALQPHLQPYVQQVLQCFGTRRVLWGSDWPVLNLAGDLPGWLALSETLLDSCALFSDASPGRAEAHAAVFGGNAQRFYRLHRPQPKRDPSCSPSSATPLAS